MPPVAKSRSSKMAASPPTSQLFLKTGDGLKAIGQIPSRTPVGGHDLSPVPHGNKNAMKAFQLPIAGRRDRKRGVNGRFVPPDFVQQQAVADEGDRKQCRK